MNALRIPHVRLPVAVLVWFALGWLSGCSKHAKPAPVGGSTVPPSQVKLKRSVELTRAEQKALTYYVETVGYLEAEGQTEIAAGVNGVVDEVLFREGQWVTQDTILVKVDQRRYQYAAEVAHAQVQRAEAALTLARDLAERSRVAGRGASEEDRAKTLLSMRVAEAELLAAKATLNLAEHNVRRSQVRAPYTGQINSRKVTPGTYLEDKSMIATMADLSRLRLVGWIPEKAAPTVRDLHRQQEPTRIASLVTAGAVAPGFWSQLVAQGLEAQGEWPTFALEFTLAPFPQQTFRGRIFYMSSVASPETHMFECKAEVLTRHRTNRPEPGFTARIRCPLRSTAAACVIAEEAVRASERGFIAFVPVAKPGKDGQTEWVAKARTVEPGFRSPGYVEVLKGIQPGEWLVRRGAEALEDGTPIRFPDQQMEQLLAQR